MNIRNLMTRLDTIAEASKPAPAAPNDARSQYDKFKADDARAAAVAQVKKWMSTPLSDIGRLGDAIDPKTGIIYYGDAGVGPGRQGGGEAKPYPYKWLADPDSTSDQSRAMYKVLGPAGLKVIPVEKKSLFGSYQVAGISPQQLADLDKPVAPPVTSMDDSDDFYARPFVQPTPGVDPGVDPSAARMAELDKLRDQLLATLKGGQNPSPVNTTDPVVPPKKVPADTSTGDKLKMGASIGAGALAGQQLAKRAGFGPIGQGVASATGGAVGGMTRQVMKEDAIIYQSSIAQSLTESFGYDYEGQLDEYSWDKFKTDAGDTLRGAANGVTLGTYDNIAAGVGSAFCKDTYAKHLAAQTAASKEAEMRNPILYTAGNIAGSLAVPIPGAAAGRLAMTGAKALGGTGKIAQGAANIAGIGGANYAASQATQALKGKADTATLGYNPNKYPTTPQAVMAFQKANGLSADGKIGPKTQAALTKMGLTPPTAAEGIQSLRDKLAMIESQPHTQVIRVWLTPENLVFTDDGEQITDHELLENIEWPTELLAEYDYIGGLTKLLGRGGDDAAAAAIKNATKQGRVFKAKPGNVNAPRANLPGAPRVTKDLTGAPIKPGELSATGSIGAARAQQAADNAVDAGRAAGKSLTDPLNKMVAGGVAARAADDAAGAAVKAAGDDAARVAVKGSDDAAKLPQATPTVGAYSVKNPYAVAGKTADDAAGVAGKELTAAEKAAAAAEAKAASQSGKLKAWAKANPRKAIALGLGALAGVTALGIAASGGDETEPGPGPGPGPNDPPPQPAPADTTTGELTAEQKAIIAKMQEIMSGYRDTEDPDLLSHITPADAAIEKAIQSKQAPMKKESVDTELARWLKIAHG